MACVLAAGMAAQDRFFVLNMRSIYPNGTASRALITGMPWARSWAGPMTVVFGHDARRGLQLRKRAVGLDSGCVYGGQVTALVVPSADADKGEPGESELIAVQARRAYVET